MLSLAGSSAWASAPFGRVPLEVNQETYPELFRFFLLCWAPMEDSFKLWLPQLPRCCTIDTSLDDSSVLELDVANRQHNCMLSWRASFRTTILVGRDSKRRNATGP